MARCKTTMGILHGLMQRELRSVPQHHLAVGWRKRAAAVAAPSSYGLNVLCVITHEVIYRCSMVCTDKRAHTLCFLSHLVSAKALCAAGVRGAGEEGQCLRPRLPQVVEGGQYACDGSQDGDRASQVVGCWHARNRKSIPPWCELGKLCAKVDKFAPSIPAGTCPTIKPLEFTDRK